MHFHTTIFFLLPFFQDIDEYKRSRRVPMMMPQNYFFKAPLASAFGDEDYDYDSGE